VPTHSPGSPQPGKRGAPCWHPSRPPARCGLDFCPARLVGQRLEQPALAALGTGAPGCQSTASPSASASTEKRARIAGALGPAAGVTRFASNELGSPTRSRAMTGALGAHSWPRPWRGDGRQPAELQVDANGGWDLATACSADSLAGRAGGGCWMEQPLPAPGRIRTLTLPASAALDTHCPIRWWPMRAGWDLADLAAGWLPMWMG